MKVRKTLAEALILSKINYCNVVYGQLPKYLINRIQRVQNITAGYVYGPYAKMLEVINLNWLPIEENIEINNVKLAHKSLNDELWPNYLKLALVERKRNLRSSELGPIIVCKISLQFNFFFFFCFLVQQCSCCFTQF